MELLVVIPLGVLALGALVWTWWSARAGHDPTSSVSSFHRALAAMEPEGGHRTSQERQHAARTTPAPDDGADDSADGSETSPGG